MIPSDIISEYTVYIPTIWNITITKPKYQIIRINCILSHLLRYIDSMIIIQVHSLYFFLVRQDHQSKRPKISSSFPLLLTEPKLPNISNQPSLKDAICAVEPENIESKLKEEPCDYCCVGVLNPPPKKSSKLWNPPKLLVFWLDLDWKKTTLHGW
jgi:hypothetical protein